MSSEETEWKLLEKRIKQKEEWNAKKLNTTEDEECKCLKCHKELDWQSGSSMEWEIWHCKHCDIEYEVDVELVRFWNTIKERY